jgi:hypothetical protein
MAFGESITQNTDIVDYQLGPNTPAEWKVFIRPSSAPAGTLELVSFLPGGGQEEGSNLCIFNDSGADIVLKHNDTRGDVNYRIQCSTGADITLPNGTPLWGLLLESAENQPNGWHFEAP